MSNDAAIRRTLHQEDPCCRLCGRATVLDADCEDPAFAVCKKIKPKTYKHGEQIPRVLICRQCCKEKYEPAKMTINEDHAAGVAVLTKMCLTQKPFASADEAMASGIGKVFECPFCLLWHRTMTFRTHREIEEQLRIGRAFIARYPSHHIVLRLERKMAYAPQEATA